MRRTTPAAANRVSDSASRRRIRARGRVVISLAASALVHAALLAWVTVDMPQSRHAAKGLPRQGQAAESSTERVIEVVRIQPPGKLPSGGSAGSAAGAIGQSAAVAAAAPVRLPPVSMPGAAGTSVGLLTFVAAPASPMALPALGETPGKTQPANRGILRRRPESGAFSGQGTGRTSSASGKGFGGGGVTAIGVWTDCITAGLQGPRDRIGLGLPGKGFGRGQGLGGIGGRRMGWSGR
ncbi:hypothetical protein [Candidatus Palauibacter sp.]|uniref:hypothetical protein n=1 Tax=Candidatus Palauibacter sp. TaxID=3101350 RepID=UPI003B5C1BA8